MAEMHYFDIEVARLYGVNSAVLLQNIYHWIKKNKANGTNEFDGNTWTYNSKKAFAELFPYMNERQIDYALKKLIDDEIIITGNYNKVAYDRTLWYAITKKGYSILQNCKMEDTKTFNGIDDNAAPIPNIKQDNKQTDINAGKKERKSASASTVRGSFDAIIADYTNDEKIIDLLQEWLKVRKAKRAAMTDRAIKMNIAKLDDLARKSDMTVEEYLSEIICRGWAAFYEINNYGGGTAPEKKNSTGGNVFLEIARDGARKREDFQRHEYSKERLESALVNFDEWENVEK